MVQDVYQGRSPNEILEEAIKNRPVPAIEKPLGLRATEASKPVVLIDNLGAFANWNEAMRGKERG